jgi:hypothetical protein
MVYTFINSSGISDLCGTVAGMVTPKWGMSTEGETLQVSDLPYRCSIAPFCCVVAQPISEVPEGLTNYPVSIYIYIYIYIFPRNFCCC